MADDSPVRAKGSGVRGAQVEWCRLGPGWIKVNTNAAFQVNDYSGATVCIIRDHRGGFRVAQDRGLDVCMMEAMACRDGLLLAKQHGELRVMLDTDCLELINLWKKKGMQYSTVDPVLKEIDVLRLAFQEFSFSYVNRSCNKIAHTLAKHVSSTRRTEVCHVTPVCVCV